MRKILSISNDPSLLETRQRILERAGYDVSSVLGFAEALEICKTRQDFDLVLMGHTIPQKDKIALFEALRKSYKVPPALVSLLRQGQTPIDQADSWLDANDGPDALLKAIEDALKGSQG